MSISPSRELPETAVLSIPDDRPTTEAGIRLARPEDTPAIVDLIAASYDCQNTPERLAYWRWKHENNPFGVSPCVVAESNGRLVGVRVFLRWTWRSGTSNVRAVRAVDTATHPGWRGKGIFSRLTKALVEQMRDEGTSFIYNTPNAQSMPGYLKMGWSAVTRIPLWIRPIRISGLVRHAFGGAPAQSPTMGAMGSAASVLDDARLSAFLSTVSLSDHRYHTAHTPAYLQWRYGRVPGLSYVARFEMVGDAGALVIARARARGRFREATISDLLVTPSSDGVRIGRALVSHLVREADADYVAACAARDTAERHVLALSGFLPAPRLGPHFTARRLNPVGPDPTQWASWRCSIGDLELF